MDAMQKRKARQVAIGYFLLSTFVFVNTIMNGHDSAEFWGRIFLYLQPIYWFFAAGAASKSYLFVDRNTMSASSIVLVAVFLSVPIWSLCFGWLYARTVNWLNHFPILGKKVF